MSFTPTTSGSFTFRLNVADAIIQAFGLNGFTSDSIDTQDWFLAKNQLNLLFADWASRGNTLFEVKFGVEPLSLGQISFALPFGLVDVYEAVLRDNSTGQQIDAPFLTRISRAEYMNKPDKTTLGTPTMYFVDRLYISQFYMYQTPQVATWQIFYSYVSQIEDVVTAAEYPDVPYRWQNALVCGLAVDIAFFKKNYGGIPLLQEKYDRAYAMAAMGDRDSSNLRVMFDLSAYTTGGR